MASPTAAVLIGSMRPHFARARSNVLRYLASLLALSRSQLELLARRARVALQNLSQGAAQVRTQLPSWRAQGARALSLAGARASTWRSLARTRTSVALTRSAVALTRTRKLVRAKLRMNAAPSDQVDPKLLRAIGRLSDNLDELDDRSLMQLRLATVAILCRIREEVQVRSALDV